MKIEKNKGLRNKVIIALTLLFLIVFGASYNTGYLYRIPYEAMGTKDLIDIRGYRSGESELYFLVYSQGKVVPLNYLFARLNPKVDIFKSNIEIPKGLDHEDYEKINQNFYLNSIAKAKYVALTYAGFEAEITSQGLLVEAVLEGYGAGEALERGDIILTVNDEPMNFDEDLAQVLKNKEIGSYVTVEILREDQKHSFRVQVGEGRPGQRILGMMTNSIGMAVASQINIDIGQQSTGPSAGMMFALEIYNRLMDEDITKGLTIAGTGQINLDGTIGGVYGIRQKVFSAEDLGADILFCPVQNYQEAAAVASKIKVIAVSTFEEVLEYLGSVDDN